MNKNSNTMIDSKLQLLLFILLSAFFLVCRVDQVSDSNFNLLLSHNLYKHQHDNILPYLKTPPLDKVLEKQTSFGVIRRELRSDKDGNSIDWATLTYPRLPIVLEIPFVFITDTFGFPIVSGNPPQWNSKTERTLQPILASFLMAIFGLLFYRTTRLWLSQILSLWLMLPIVIGSSILSTLSRALWTDTWATFFIMLSIHHLAHAHHQKNSVRPVYITVILSMAFFCKPIYAVSVLACLFWLLIIMRHEFTNLYSIFKNKAFILMGVTGILLLSLFYLWSIKMYAGGLLSNYSFQQFSGFNIYFFLGQFISPSRGIIIFWSWVIPLIAATIVLWKHIGLLDRKLLMIISTPIFLNIMILSFYPFWHGGLGYGPRLNTPSLPWLGLASIIMIATWVKCQSTQRSNKSYLQKFIFSRVFYTMTHLLIVWAVVINIFGAIEKKSFVPWHAVKEPKIDGLSKSDSRYTAIFWDWHDPIFLAGMIKPERYFNISITHLEPEIAETIMNQVNTGADLLDTVKSRKELMLPPPSQPSNLP